MASVSSLSSSSSLYGSRNVISGLASGMDTESMIQNSVKGYQTKITTLQQKRQKVEWQQEAYRSMISKMTAFTNKYASYTSSTNLLSRSFFNQSVTTTTNGAYANKVSATGKTTSKVQIDRVQQLATAARYSIGSNAVAGDATVKSVQASGSINPLGETKTSKTSGQIALAYGGNSNPTYVYLSLDDKVYESNEDLKAALEEQLENEGMGDRIQVNLDDAGNISFTDKKGAGNSVKISKYGNTGNLAELGDLANRVGTNSFNVGANVNGVNENLYNKQDTGDYLANVTLDMTIDGVTKAIRMPSMDDVLSKIGKTKDDIKDLQEKVKNGSTLTTDEEDLQKQINDAYVDLLNESVNNSFKDSGVTVSNAATDGTLKLQFDVADSKTKFSVTSRDGEALGIGGGLSNYVSEKTTLDQLISMKGEAEQANWQKKKDGDGNYKLTIGGQEFTFSGDTTLQDMFSKINDNKKVDFTANYSSFTDEFTFTAKETGKDSEFDMGDLKALFGDPENVKDGASYEKGQNAIFTATVDGKVVENKESASNTIDIDGLSVTLKGTFGYNEDGSVDKTAEAVTFTTNTNSDKIVDTIKQMIEDYNEMVTEIKNAYSTMPLQKTGGSSYEPLTEDDEADMSESAIEKYNEKAKTGLLFGDSDVSAAYQKLTAAASTTGEVGAVLRSIGIETVYSNGLTTLKLDESKLREALDSDPDKVRDAFTQSKDNGAKEDGLMTALKAPLDAYANKSNSIFVTKAGSITAPSSIYTNFFQKQLDNIDKEIEKWQDKLSDQVDYYTSKFTSLEQLVANMNSQSSALSQMTGSF